MSERSEPSMDVDTTAGDVLPGTDTSGAAEAPELAGDDVRPGPELTDEPAAGATEPSD